MTSDSEPSAMPARDAGTIRPAHKILDNVTDAVLAIDGQGCCAYLNQRAAALLGVDRRSMLGAMVWEECPEAAALLSQPATEALAEGEIRSFDTYWPPAATWLECRCVPFADLVFVFLTETAARRQAETMLRESENRFRVLAEALPHIVWSARADGTVDYYNQRLADYTGLAPSNGQGWGWRVLLHPDDKERTVAAWQAAVESGQPYQIEHRVGTIEGIYRWHLSRGLPMHDEEGNVLRWFGTATDIHDQKEAERELAEHRERLEELVRSRTVELESSHNRLRLTERMAALGTLSAGLGHDMGNLLMPVRIRLESMEAAGLPERFQADVMAIRKATEYLQRLTNGLRLLSLDPDADGPLAEAARLDEWWFDAEPMMRNVLPRGVTLEAGFDDGAAKVGLARHRLTQAVFNLVQNAGEALRERGTVRVWSAAQEGTGWLRLGVSDNGPGMTEAVRRRCLEPFFTTKTRGISTGLGLALVHGIVQKAGGRLEVRSEPGAGATFEMLLPPAETQKAVRSGSVAVVGVGDARIRTYVGSLARSLGFQVVEEKAGEAADGACLWVTESIQIERVREFLAGDPRRRVVALGTPPVPHPAGLVVLGAAPKPADLRRALQQAATACAT